MANPKVLIVDDEPDIVESIRFNLEGENIDCVEANDGEEALFQAKMAAPDLILLDVMLPKMNGYEVCRILKYDEEREHIPVIMLTSRTQDTDKLMGERVSADEYVCKPFIMDELVSMIKKYLNRSE